MYPVYYPNNILFKSCPFAKESYRSKKKETFIKFQGETFTHGFKVLPKSLSFHLLLINFRWWNFQSKLKHMA